MLFNSLSRLLSTYLLGHPVSFLNHLLCAEGDGGHQGDIVDGGVALNLLCGSEGPATAAAALVLGLTDLRHRGVIT